MCEKPAGFKSLRYHVPKEFKQPAFSRCLKASTHGEATSSAHSSKAWCAHPDAQQQPLCSLPFPLHPCRWSPHSLQSCSSESTCASTDASATQPSSESPQPTQPSAEVSPPSLRAILAARMTPRPSVVSEPAGPFPTAQALPDQPAGLSSSHCSISSPTRHRSLDAVKAIGVVESWQVLDADADIVTVWEKYEEVFFGDYHPVPSTYRR